MLRQSDLEVEIIEDGRGEAHVPVDPGSDVVGHHQGLELVKTEVPQLAFLTDDVAEEDSFLRVVLTGIPGPLSLRIA